MFFENSHRVIVEGIYGFIVNNQDLIKQGLKEIIPFKSIDYYENDSYNFIIEDIYLSSDRKNFNYHHIEIKTGLYHVHLHIKDDDSIVKASSDSKVVCQALISLYNQEKRNNKLAQLC